MVGRHGAATLTACCEMHSRPDERNHAAHYVLLLPSASSQGPMPLASASAPCPPPLPACQSHKHPPSPIHLTVPRISCANSCTPPPKAWVEGGRAEGGSRNSWLRHPLPHSRESDCGQHAMSCCCSAYPPPKSQAPFPTCPLHTVLSTCSPDA